MECQLKSSVIESNLWPLLIDLLIKVRMAYVTAAHPEVRARNKKIIAVSQARQLRAPTDQMPSCETATVVTKPLLDKWASGYV
jgi:hypothetical protein